MNNEAASFHVDPNNWKVGFIYFCRRDRRLIVPRRSRLGWTLNFGRPWAFAIPVFLFIIVAGVIAISRHH